MGDPMGDAVGVPPTEPDGREKPLDQSGSGEEPSVPESAASGEVSSGTADQPDQPLPDDSGTSEATDPRPSLDQVVAALAGVEAQIHGFHARAENYEQIVRQMQNRIEQLQGDQVQALLKPVIQRFAGLHAQAAEASEKARERGESAEKDFGFFAVAIEEALGLVDIESVGAAPHVEFDSRKHHASRIVPTPDPNLDQRVQRVLRQGFTYVGAPRVFLPAQVSVYRYEPPQPVAADEASENNPTSEPREGVPSE